jgi:branched-chain amino acid transport system ATP-binding protein
MTGHSRTLVLDGFSVRYGKALALSDVSLSFSSGAVTAVTGPNGAGKSTLLLGIRGTVASTGDISLGGADVRAMDTRERARAIAIVPQGRQLFPRMTVRENLQVMAEILRLPRDSVDGALDRFPVLRRRSRSYAGVLSGGEQQMLAVSRSLLGDPSFLLLDEPMTGLAPLVVQSINDTIRSLAAEGVGVIVAEPAVRALRSTVETGHVLIRGAVAATATTFEDLERSYQAVMGMEEREVEQHVLAAQDE